MAEGADVHVQFCGPFVSADLLQLRSHVRDEWCSLFRVELPERVVDSACDPPTCRGPTELVPILNPAHQDRRVAMLHENSDGESVSLGVFVGNRRVLTGDEVGAGLVLANCAEGCHDGLRAVHSPYIAQE